MRLTGIHHWDKATERLDFTELDLVPRSQETLECQIWTKQLVFTLRREPIDGLLSKSHGYFIGTRKTSEYSFVTLNLFSRSHES